MEWNRNPGGIKIIWNGIERKQNGIERMWNGIEIKVEWNGNVEWNAKVIHQ